MSDSPETASFPTMPAGPAQPVTASAGAPAPEFAGPAGGVAAEHPELLVGAAFAGGLLLATILKRLAN
jgi:hypothetical protein